MENLPFNQNINIAQLVGLACSLLVLATGGKVNLTLADQLQIVALIQSAAAVYTMIVHTFFNHPANQEKAKAMVAAAVAAARHSAPALALFSVIGLGVLGGCSTISSLLPTDPKSALTDVQYGAALAETAFEAICPTTGSGPSFCATALPEYLLAKAALNAAINTAAVAINVSGDVDSANIEALLTQVENDWTTFNSIVNTTQAKDTVLRGVQHKVIALHGN